MSKATCIDSGDLYNLTCGHIISDFDVDGPPTLGDEVACPICAETEKRVKAARVEVLEADSERYRAARRRGWRYVGLIAAIMIAWIIVVWLLITKGPE